MLSLLGMKIRAICDHYLVLQMRFQAIYSVYLPKKYGTLRANPLSRFAYMFSPVSILKTDLRSYIYIYMQCMHIYGDQNIL